MPTKEQWKNSANDETIWQAKRKSLVASSPSIIDYDKSRTTVVSNKRKDVIDAMTACVALGLDDNPKGRKQAYIDVITPFEDTVGRGTGALPCPNSSSCGLFIRGIWQLLGTGKPRTSSKDRNFRGSYVAGSVIVNILLYAEDCGALTGKSDQTGVLKPDEIKKWKKGDIIFVAKDKTPTDIAHQHIFTLAEDPKPGQKLANKFDTFEIHSIDGGASQTTSDMKAGKHAGDSNCRSIQLSKKQVVLHKTEMRIAFPPWGEAQVRAWIDLDKIPFDDAPILPVRKTP